MVRGTGGGAARVTATAAEGAGGFLGRRLGTGGRYTVLGLLGRGAMGVVVRARDGVLHRDVAVKVLAPTLATGPGFADRFRREARILASLDGHPHILPVYDFGQEADG